jgi:hypothetical protein
MAMGMRLGAGGVPMLPFAGDPNGGGGPVPVVGQILVDTVGGGVYQGVRGGKYGTLTTPDILTIPGSAPSPTTESFSILASMRIPTPPAANRVIVANRIDGLGYIVLLLADGGIQIGVQTTTALRYRANSLNAVGKSINYAVSWDHAAGILRTRITGDILRSTNSALSIASTSTDAQIQGDSDSSHTTPFFCVKNRVLTDTEIADWTERFIEPVGDCSQRYDMRAQVLSGSNLPNLGTAGGNFTLSDAAPTDWGTALTWIRIA